TVAVGARLDEDWRKVRIPSGKPLTRDDRSVRVLLIEDDHRLANLLASRLQREGFDATPCFTGSDGLEQASTGTFDLAVMDVMLPGMDGIALTEALRARGIQMPILMLTAKDTVDDRVTGLRSGADDYLVKPFAFAELLARIEALTRRFGRDHRLTCGSVTLDPLSRRVTVEDR